MSLNSKHAFHGQLVWHRPRGRTRLAERGAKVAIHYYQNAAAAHETLAQVRARGSDGFIIQADVTQPEKISRMFNRMDHGASDLRRWWGVTHEPGSPTRNSARIVPNQACTLSASISPIVTR